MAQRRMFDDASLRQSKVSASAKAGAIASLSDSTGAMLAGQSMASAGLVPADRLLGGAMVKIVAL